MARSIYAIVADSAYRLRVGARYIMKLRYETVFVTCSFQLNCMVWASLFLYFFTPLFIITHFLTESAVPFFAGLLSNWLPPPYGTNALSSVQLPDGVLSHIFSLVVLYRTLQ